MNEYEELDLAAALDMNETRSVIDSKGRTYKPGQLFHDMVGNQEEDLSFRSFLPVIVYRRHKKQIDSAIRSGALAGIPNNLIRDAD